jgi:hypothetical protein
MYQAVSRAKAGPYRVTLRREMCVVLFVVPCAFVQRFGEANSRLSCGRFARP